MSGQMENRTVGGSIAKLYLKSDFADVHFAIRNGSITVKVPAHKNILAVGSNVFAAMFYGKLKENEVVNIVDTDASAFEEFLQLFYLSEINISKENIKEVVRLVDKYDVLDIFNTCAELHGNQLNENNIFWSYQLAILLNNQALKKSCDVIVQGLKEVVFKSEMFLQCDREVVKNILQLNSLNCNEAVLFDACVAWAKSSCERNGLDENNPKNLRNELGDCFDLIRFGTMSNEAIGVIMTNEIHAGLFSRDELSEFLRVKTTGKLKQIPRLRSTPKFKLTRDLNWKRVQVAIYGYEQYIIRQRESTFFSTNCEILLGDEITFISLTGNHMIEFTVKIIEYEQPFPILGTSQVFFTNSVTYEEGATGYLVPKSLHLDRTILIKPKKMYEIRLKFIKIPQSSTSFINGCTHNASNNFRIYQIDDLVKIQFHQNPQAPTNRGLVASLCVSRV